MMAVMHFVPCSFSIIAILPSGIRKAANGTWAWNVVAALTFAPCCTSQVDIVYSRPTSV